LRGFYLGLRCYTEIRGIAGNRAGKSISRFRASQN